MEVISIQENYFHESSFAEFSLIENFSEPMVEPFKVCTLPKLGMPKQFVLTWICEGPGISTFAGCNTFKCVMDSTEL